MRKVGGRSWYWLSRALFIVPVAALVVWTIRLNVGSDENGVEACETLTKEGLKSPSSYKRIKSLVEPYEPGKPRRTVWLTYEAANAYGTMIQGDARCDLRPSDDGEFHEVDSIVLAAQNDKAARELRMELPAD